MTQAAKTKAKVIITRPGDPRPPLVDLCNVTKTAPPSRELMYRCST